MIGLTLIVYIFFMQKIYETYFFTETYLEFCDPTMQRVQDLYLCVHAACAKILLPSDSTMV